MAVGDMSDSVFIKELLSKSTSYGIVTDPNNPNLFAATMEIFQDDATATTPVLEGPVGPAGQAQFALRLQTDSITSPDDLPADLTNSEADIGKYWVLISGYDDDDQPLGTNAYIWYGTGFRTMPIGSQGPPGTYPVISPSIELISHDETSVIEHSGTVSHPNWHLELSIPTAPRGYGPKLAESSDVDLTTDPDIGQLFGYSNSKWRPISKGSLFPSFYSVPESAFTSYPLGIETTAPQVVCQFTVPAQPFPWKPYVMGHLSLSGFSIGPNLHQIGAEVRSGGLLVAKGLSQPSGSMYVMPHFSSTDSPARCVTPGNDTMLVQAGQQLPLTVNIVNERWLGIYSFHAENSQLSVLAVPV